MKVSIFYAYWVKDCQAHIQFVGTDLEAAKRVARSNMGRVFRTPGEGEEEDELMADYWTAPAGWAL